MSDWIPHALCSRSGTVATLPLEEAFEDLLPRAAFPAGAVVACRIQPGRPASCGPAPSCVSSDPPAHATVSVAGAGQHRLLSLALSSLPPHSLFLRVDWVFSPALFIDADELRATTLPAGASLSATPCDIEAPAYAARACAVSVSGLRAVDGAATLRLPLHIRYPLPCRLPALQGGCLRAAVVGAPQVYAEHAPASSWPLSVDARAARGVPIRMRVAADDSHLLRAASTQAQDVWASVLAATGLGHGSVVPPVGCGAVLFAPAANANDEPAAFASALVGSLVAALIVLRAAMAKPVRVKKA